MNVTVTPKPKSKFGIQIELPTEEFSPFIQNAIQVLASQVKLAGFRPGKAPRDVIEKKVGLKAILEEAADLAVRSSFPKAILQEKIRTIGSPTISVEKLAEGNPFIYSAEVAVLPKVVIGDLSKVKIERKPADLKPDHVDETLKRLQKMQASEVRAERPAKTGDRVDVDFNVFLDNVPLDGGQGKNMPLTIGDKAFIPGFEEQLVGMKALEEKTFKLTFPKDYGKKDLQGKEAEFKVKLHAVYDVNLPTLDDAFAKRLGKFESMEQLRAEVEKNLKEEADQKEQNRYEQAIVEAALETSKVGEVPEILITSEQDKMLHELEHAVTGDGGKFDDYLSSIKKTREDLKNEFAKRATQRVQVALLLRALAEQQNLIASEAEVQNEIQVEKLRLTNQPEVLKQVEGEDYRDYLKMVLTNRKVINWLSEKTKKGA
jgi:trigger factor